MNDLEQRIAEAIAESRDELVELASDADPLRHHRA